ncbi:hypothetical protein D3C72_2586580 [compost metagenome]
MPKRLVMSLPGAGLAKGMRFAVSRMVSRRVSAASSSLSEALNGEEDCGAT